MTESLLQYTLRRPRFHTAPYAELQLAVHLDSSAARPTVFPAELLDLSRDGVKLRAEQPLQEGEQVVLEVSLPEASFALSAPAQVLWHRREAGAWLIGCRFCERLEWEQLGELFLHGVLTK